MTYMDQQAIYLSAIKQVRRALQQVQELDLHQARLSSKTWSSVTSDRPPFHNRLISKMPKKIKASRPGYAQVFAATKAFARLYDPTVNHSSHDIENEVFKLYEEYFPVLSKKKKKGARVTEVGSVEQQPDREANNNDDVHPSPPTSQYSTRGTWEEDRRESVGSFEREVPKPKKKKRGKKRPKIADVEPAERRPSRETDDNNEMHPSLPLILHNTSDTGEGDRWESVGGFSSNDKAIQKATNAKGNGIVLPEIQDTNIPRVIDDIIRQRHPSDIPSRILVIVEGKTRTESYINQVLQSPPTHGLVQYTRLTGKGSMATAATMTAGTIVVLGSANRMAYHMAISSQLPIRAILLTALSATQKTVSKTPAPTLKEFLNSGPKACPHLYLLDVPKNTQTKLDKNKIKAVEQFRQLKYTALTVM